MYADRLRAFRQGLKDTGFVDARTWRPNTAGRRTNDRLPALAAELVRRQVAVIYRDRRCYCAPLQPRLQPRRSPSSSRSEDPVRLGLVASLARPGGNLTGINIFTAELAAKRLELLREVVPTAVAWPCSSIRPMLPTGRLRRETWQQLLARWGCKFRSSMRAPAARSMRLSQLLHASGPTPSSSAPTPFFTSRRVQLALLAAHHSIPMHFQYT